MSQTDSNPSNDSTLRPLVLVAIGGNSLISDSEHMSVLDQYRAAGETAKHIVGLVAAGNRVVITHGNGPQVGFILMRAEMAREILHTVPLESCVADTQGAIGYQITQTLGNELRKRNIRQPLAAVVTQVVVAADDPAFDDPTKPIGPWLSIDEAQEHQREDGWLVTRLRPGERGWRRVVASPRPLRIIEEDVVRILVDNGVLVIAAGGGGIPVTASADERLTGCAAVIDKDAVSSLLASHLDAETLIISTNVEKVALGFGTAEVRWLDLMTVDEARMHLADGQFPPGSMGPKIEAAIRFLESGGRRVIITKPDRLEEAFAGRTGTQIVP